jgi:spermidine synthase
MKPLELLGEACSLDGSEMKLVRRGSEYMILVAGQVLMSSRTHGSEETLATVACERVRTLEQPVVLIGGLGMGFTLRAALDVLPPRAVVVVAELIPAVAEWNHGPLGPLAGWPLQDRRVSVELKDVALVLRASRSRFDAVLLDVDNGPAALTAATNFDLYGPGGLAAVLAALKPGGVLAVWSAREDREFEQRLGRAGFSVETVNVRGGVKGRGSRHKIFLGQKTGKK